MVKKQYNSVKENASLIRLIATIIMFCSFTRTYAQQVQYWTALPKPTQYTLNSVYFTDSLHGWITGQNGVLMYTSNGGSSWQQKISGTTSEIPSIFIRTTNDIWSLEFKYPIDDTSWYGTNILHSTNGGSTWSVQRYDSTIFRTIVFQDSLTGFMGGSYGTIVKTTNGGQSWYKVSDSSLHKYPVYKIKFFDKNYGFAIGGQLEIAGIVWKTTDGGETWRSKIIGGDPVFSIHYFDSLHVFVGMADIDQSGAIFLRTIDGGISWTAENTPLWGEPTNIAFRTATEFWVPMGIGGLCLRSIDEGFTWEQIPVQGQIPVYDVCFPNERTGYMVGHKGALYKFNAAVLSVNEQKKSRQEYSLSHNYPNPFNGTTTITYHLSKTSYVSITVYDIVGRNIESLVDEVQQEGNYSVRWDSKNISSGLFFYRLRAGDFVQSGRMILQR
ncbi:MAG: YCF48-related protein [Bacteroidota bacterium]